MEEANDPIKALLEKTGLSCDDLLQKLLAYKSLKKDETVNTNLSEVIQESHINYDTISSEKINSPCTNGPRCLDFGHISKCNNEEKNCPSSKHSSDKFHSSNGSPNSAKSADCTTPQSSDIFCSKKANSCTIEGTNDAEGSNVFMESQSCQMNVGSNISRDILNDYENFSPPNLNPSGVFTISEIGTRDVVTKETHYNTSPEENAPKKYGEETSEIPPIHLEENMIFHNLALGKVERENVSKNIEIKNIFYNEKLQSSEKNSRCEDDKTGESRKTLESTINTSTIEVISSTSEKNENLLNQPTISDSALVYNKRKSISDELVRRLVQRVSEDEIKESDNESDEREHGDRNIEQVRDVTNSDGVQNHMENDIEVCQIEDLAEIEPVQPLLKLRNDLFETDNVKRFTTSESKFNIMKGDVESSYMKDSLLNKENLNDSNSTDMDTQIYPTDNIDQAETTNTNMRKIKVGFVKKKIHKAIRHLNRADSNKFRIINKNEISDCGKIEKNKDHYFQMPLPKLSLESHVDTPEAQEEIRKNLKIQLSSLRNRKKTGTTTEENQCKKVQSIGDLKFNYKKQILNDEVQNNSTESLFTANTKATSASVDEPQTSSSNVGRKLSADKLTEVLENNNSSLFSLSEETNFMIVDVQGGVEFPENEIDDRSKDFHYDGIKLTKTNDITKIKGWKNKKFDVASKKGTSDSEKDINEMQTEDTSNNCDILPAPSISKDDSSNSAETLKMDENSSEELSPFVSNTLEEFLTENSRLNISYKIPKLGAEEGLRKLNYKDVVLPKQSDQPPATESENKDKPKGMKPKTLAEKRRMLEGKISIKGRPKKKEYTSISKTSYIYFNERKIYVPSASRNKCLASINFQPSRRTENSHSVEKEISTPKKLSLLKLWLEKSKVVKYKPGPLSQKPNLQNSETISIWDTVAQKLPKIVLQLIPGPGKVIPPHLVPLLPQHGPVIKSDYLEFALSAVHTKSADQHVQGFRFSIPYRNNQKYILMRKKKEKYQGNIVCDIEPEKNSVASVIDDIISYVEIKEIKDSIIKDAEPYEEDEHEEEPKPVKSNEINIVEDNFAKKHIKRRKLEMELQRLSCKVVSVTVEDKETIDVDCNKSYCKLGCICRSLACTSHLPLHCSRKDCMFECKCSANGEISISGDNSLLSSDTVTRIEDQAKRNLAKVEKEFTQTIIHANNKTILIPSSDRSKTKRVKRTPKRYSDFLENYDVEDDIVTTSKENERAKVCTTSANYNCSVELEKLDLKALIPFCLDHNCYNCNCIPDIVPLYTEKKKHVCTDEESVVEETIRPKKIKKNKIHKDENSIKESNIKPIDRASSGDNSETDYSRNCATYEHRRKKQKEGCARVCGVHPEFVARNEIPYYKNKLKLKFRSTDNLDTLLHTAPQNLNSDEGHSDIVDVTTPMTISGCDRLRLLRSEYVRHKRKQILEVRVDSDAIVPSQKVKKLKIRQRKSQDSFSEPAEKGTREDLPYTSIFDGEIVIPTNANKDFVKNLGVKSVAPYMRLLPWNDLLRNYYSLKINIWCSYEKSDKLLINTSNMEPPEGYVDITQSKRKNGIMMWILTKELPKQTPAELVHLILSPNNEHFEISGICLKNIPFSKYKRKTKKVTEHENIENNFNHTEEVNEIVKVNGDSQDPVNNDPNFLEHKNHNNELNVLCLTQHEFSPQLFYLAPICVDICYEKFPLAVELPIIRPQFRWRMLYLNSNFSFLSFINNKYSIKYTDLMHILKKAQYLNKTICLQSKQLSSGYSQKNYGIYAVPNYRDRLFIGPYKHDEEHGLETLRYLRQSLVNTSYFEMVQGGANPNNKKAVWLTTKLNKLRDKDTGAINLSLLLGLPQHSLIKPNVSISSSDNKEATEIYNEENSQFAELTPILTPPISDTSPPVSDVPATLSEEKTQTATIEINKQIDPTNELQGISEHSKLLEGCENFVTSMDLEERPFIKFPEFMLLNGRKMKPQEYNRYIMTNIPYFGYLGAIQNDQSKAIDIDWPFANKVLRFPNVTAATEFLKRRFTNLLLPVPASFQINLIILTEIDSTNHSPIDAKILSGTHICGEFGVLDSRKLTLPLAESLGTTQEDVLKRLAKRAQYLVRCRLRTLGLFLLPKDEQLEEVLDNVAYITNLGALEIGKLKEQEKIFIQMKKDLIIRKQNNLTKYMELLMHLPEKQRLKEYDKFRHQFNGRTKQNSTEISTKSPDTSSKKEVIECIEIEDSDSDNEKSNITAKPKHIKTAEPPSYRPQNQFVMKSILKPIKPSPTVPDSPSNQNTKPLEGYKFVKTPSGKLVLLKDNSGLTLSTSLSGMKMTIRNNQVVKRDIISNSNNAIEIVQGTSEPVRVENNQDLDETVSKNGEEDSIVALEDSDEGDIEMLE